MVFTVWESRADFPIPQMAKPTDIQAHTQLFFFLYFGMTGLHAFHMIIGVGLLTSATVGILDQGKIRRRKPSM